MAKRNKHGWTDTVTGGISYRYMHDVLGPWISCPKRNCGGTMTDVYVRYVNHGPIFKDQECTTCGKVIKDPCTFGYFREINEYNRDLRKGKSKGKARQKRIYTERKRLSKIDVLFNPRVQADLWGNWVKTRGSAIPRHRGGYNDSSRRERRGTNNSSVSKREAG